MPSPYALVGARLVERGYAAIPIKPGTKRPGDFVHGYWIGMDRWSHYAEVLPADEDIDRWSEPEDAGVGVVGGMAGLVGIDVDVDDEPIVGAIMRALPHTPVRKAGHKGVTLLFRGYVASRSFNQYAHDGRLVRRLCDVIGAGRQTVLPPTTHPDTGQPYRWIGEAALEDVDPADLPELPEDTLDILARVLAPFGYSPDPTPRQTGSAPVDADNPFRALNEAALADLGSWAPRLGLHGLRPARGGYEAVPSWRPSTTGRPIERRKRNLKLHPSGIRDMGADRSYTAIDLVMVASGCDFDTAFGQLAGWLGLVPTLEVNLASKATHQRLGDGTLVDMETGEVVDVASSPPVPESDEVRVDFVSAILGSPCLVGEIARWIIYISRRPQPRLAVAAAIATVATATSRQLVTPTYGNLNLFMVMTARSGMGKDAPLKAVKSIFGASKLFDLLGPEGVASDVGLFDYARIQPASIMTIDEFGDFLSAASGRQASSYTLRIMAAMRKLYDGGMIATTHARSRRAEMLINPCISMICASTPGQFYDAIGSAEVLNGFLNRFILVNAPSDAPRGEDDRDPTAVPEHICVALSAIADRPGGMNHMRFRTMAENLLEEDKASVVPWRTPATRGLWQRYEDFNLDRMRDDARVEAFAPRCPLNALRIATVLAVAENVAEPSVDERHIDIAIDLVETSLRDMLAGYNDHVPESPGAALAAKALQRIKDAGGSLSRRDLFRSMKRAFKKMGEFEDMMRTLVEAGSVVVSETIPEKGGPKSVVYNAVQQ